MSGPFKMKGFNAFGSASPVKQSTRKHFQKRLDAAKAKGDKKLIEALEKDMKSVEKEEKAIIPGEKPSKSKWHYKNM